jgi:hypothetical protein
MGLSSQRHVLQEMWRWLCFFCAVLAICSLHGCSAGDDDNEISSSGTYSIRVVAPKAGQWTPGANNEVVVTVPENSANKHVTLEILLEFAGLDGMDVQYIQIPSSLGKERRSSISIPSGAFRVSCNGIVDWNEQPMLNLTLPVDTANVRARFFSRISTYKNVDSLVQIEPKDDELRISQILCAIRLAAQRRTYDDEYTIPLMRQASLVKDSASRSLLRALVANQSSKPWWSELYRLFSDSLFAIPVLNNVDVVEALLLTLRYQYGSARDPEVFRFAGFLLSRYPNEDFTFYSSNSQFRGVVAHEVFDSLVVYLHRRPKTLAGMTMLGKLVLFKSDSLYSKKSLRMASEYVRFLTDSIVERRKKTLGPTNRLDDIVWRTRQVCAYREIGLLEYLPISSEELLRPAGKILPTLARYEMRSASLAHLAARTLDNRGDSSLANLFYAFAARYFPSDTIPITRLNRTFAPRISSQQMDALITLLERKGYIAPQEDIDFPPDIMSIRPDPAIPTAVVFVASTCSACGPQKEILRRLRSEGMNFNIVVVFVGQWKKGQKDVYLNDKLLTCCMTEPSTFVEMLYVRSVPTCLIADAHGRLRARFDGMAPYEPLRGSLMVAAQRQ